MVLKRTIIHVLLVVSTGRLAVGFSQEPARLPLPSPEEETRVQAKLEETFGLSSLKSEADRSKVVAELSELAADPDTAAAERYVLLKESIRLTSEAGDLEYSMLLAEMLKAQFATDAISVRKEALAQFASKQRTNAESLSLLAELLQFIEEAKKQERYDIAVPFCEEISLTIQESLDSKGRTQLINMITALREEMELFKNYKSARVTLQTSPGDPKACFQIGLWLCLQKGDWDSGLSFLSNSDDPEISKNAKADLGKPMTTAARMEVAERWFSIASAKPEFAGFYRRALQCFTDLMPDLAGLDKAKAAKRIDAVKERLGTEKGPLGLRFVTIPAGEVAFGIPQSVSSSKRSQPSQRKIVIAEQFELSDCEITQAQYEAVMGLNPSATRRPDNPVEQVSWDDATEFCKRLSERREEKWSGYSYRLPSETEWEYACRGDSESDFSFGNNETKLDQYAWFVDNSGWKKLNGRDLFESQGNDIMTAEALKNRCRPHAVRRKAPNEFGLFDMHGNLYEWCQHPTWSNNAPLSQKPLDLNAKVPLRGGSWWVNSDRCKASYRLEFPRTFRNVDIGFRVVRERREVQ